MATITKVFGTASRVRAATWALVGIILSLFPGGAIAGVPRAQAGEARLPAVGMTAGIASIASGRRWFAAGVAAHEGGQVKFAAADMAGNDEKMKLAERLIGILGYERNYNKRVDRAMAFTFKALRKKYARNPELLRILRNMLAEVRQDMLERRREYFHLMARQYAEGMDKDVLVAAIRFYGSPQGQAFLRQNARVRKRAKIMGKEWVKSMMKQAMKDVLRKARERGIHL